MVVIMAKETITKENVFYKSHYQYRYILILLSEFHDKNGLAFKQLREALVKGHDIDKIRGDFGRHLRLLIAAKQIEPGCITTKNNLNKTYLRTLLDLKVITKDERYVKPRYRIKPTYLQEWYRIENKDHLDMYDSNSIFHLTTDCSDSDNNRTPSVIIYGISRRLYGSFTSKNKKKIIEHINEIENHLWKIECIKTSKILENFSEILDKICDEFNNDKLKEYIKDNFDDFFEYCYVKMGLGESKELVKWKFMHDKTLEMSLDNKIDFIWLVSQRVKKELADEVGLGAIAFSRYIKIYQNEITDNLRRIFTKKKK